MVDSSPKRRENITFFRAQIKGFPYEPELVPLENIINRVKILMKTLLRHSARNKISVNCHIRGDRHGYKMVRKAGPDKALLPVTYYCTAQ